MDIKDRWDLGHLTGGMSSVIRQLVPVTPSIQQAMVDSGVNGITRLALSTKNSVTQVKRPVLSQMR
jgi:hypothetical protein